MKTTFEANANLSTMGSILLNPTPMCVTSVAYNLTKCNKYYWTLFRKYFCTLDDTS